MTHSGAEFEYSASPIKLFVNPATRLQPYEEFYVRLRARESEIQIPRISVNLVDRRHRLERPGTLLHREISPLGLRDQSLGRLYVDCTIGAMNALRFL